MPSVYTTNYSSTRKKPKILNCDISLKRYIHGFNHDFREFAASCETVVTLASSIA